ncbi:MAG: helix-turn-helix domain containing protein [Candidatus Binatia bacterium]|nr:helix-turn-helix domain containing protein [Candidatus Binatia bacterium]
MPRPLRRSRRRREREVPVAGSRIRILEGAMKAFGQHGYNDTRVEDILLEAGVSRPTFYKFFANRDEVFDAIAESQAFSVIQSMKGAIAIAADPLERLDKAIDAYLRWRAAIGPIGTVLIAEAMRPGSNAGQQRQAILDAVTLWFTAEASEVLGTETDPLLYVGVVAALERVSSEIDQARVGEKEIQRCKVVMMQIVLGTLSWDRDRDALMEKAIALRDRPPG